MNAFIQSLNRWANDGAHFAWSMFLQSSLLILLLLLLDLFVLRRVRASLRYALWILVLVKLVLPPTLTLPTGIAYWLPNTSRSPQIAHVFPPPEQVVISYEAVPVIFPRDQLAPTVIQWPSFEAGLGMVWIVLALFLTGWLINRARVVRRMVADSRLPDDRLLAMWEECLQRFHVRGPVRLRLGEPGSTPALCGFFKPVLLIPEGLDQHLSEAHTRAVLLHEAAHLKRGDCWINLLQACLQIVYWWHPLLWFANAHIRRVREEAVDERVMLELGEASDDYPPTLIEVARVAQARSRLALGLLGIMESNSSLKSRIKRLLDHPLPRQAQLGISGLLCIGCLAVTVLPMGLKPLDLSAAEREDPALAAARFVLIEGAKLSKEQATELEQRVQSNPADLESRTRLLGYYFLEQHRSEAARPKRQPHVLWMIEHQPRHVVAGLPYTRLNRVLEPAAYELGKKLWLAHTNQSARDTLILGHAANYFLIDDPAIAQVFLEQAEVIDPANAEWSKRLKNLADLKDLARAATGQREAVALLLESSFDQQKIKTNSFPVLTLAMVESTLGRPAINGDMSLDEAVKLLKASNYVPGSVIGFDEAFLDYFGARGATMVQAASLVLNGREKSVRQLLERNELSGPDREIRDLQGPIARAEEKLAYMLQRFSDKHPAVQEQMLSIAHLRAQLHSRTFHVDPDIFIRNIEARRDETIQVRGSDVVEVLVHLLRGAGVNFAPDKSLLSFNRETGALVMWNTEEGLAIAQRLILELIQPDGKRSIYSPPSSRVTTLTTTATILKLANAEFDKLALGPPKSFPGQVGESWSVSPGPWDELKQRVTENMQAQILSRPRISNSPGVKASLYVGDAKQSVSLDCVPYLRDGFVDMSVLLRTAGYFGKSPTGDWSDTNGWTNVALMGQLSFVKGGGIVMRARHPEAKDGLNNLVVLIETEMGLPK